MDEDENKNIQIILERLCGGENVGEDEIISTVTRLIQSCHVPRLDKAEDFPYSASDFDGIADKAEYLLTIVCRVTEELCQCCEKGRKFSPLFKKSILTSCLLLASEYTDAKWDWSSENSALAANALCEKLCLFTKFDSVKHLLNGYFDDEENSADDSRPHDSNNYLEYTLQTLINTLNKKFWKSHVASKASYWFILTHLDEKSLSRYLPYMLPPALFIVDDWEQRHKIFGLRCLHFILENTAGSEIRWYGRATVIYEAVKNLMYSRESDVLEELFPTIINVAEILEADPEYTGQLRCVSTYDMIMQQLMQEMRYEQKLALRLVYSRAFLRILRAMGILAVKWSDDIILLCEDYLATYSGPLAEDRINVLKALQVYIQKSWPQIHLHAAPVMKMIVRLIYDITCEDSDLNEEVTKKLTKEALEVVHLLHAAAPKTTQDICNGLTDTEVHPKCQCLLKEIENVVSCQ